jgi:hypothetical protein
MSLDSRTSLFPCVIVLRAEATTRTRSPEFFGGSNTNTHAARVRVGSISTGFRCAKRYETAWAWLHKLRRAMVRPERELLSGVVELDQSFLGGRSHGKLGGATEKAPITIAVERLASGRLGRARLQLAEKANGLDLEARYSAKRSELSLWDLRLRSR